MTIGWFVAFTLSMVIAATLGGFLSSLLTTYATTRPFFKKLVIKWTVDIAKDTVEAIDLLTEKPEDDESAE